MANVDITVWQFLLPYGHHFRELGWQVDVLAAGVSKCPPCVSAFDHVYDAAWTRQPRDIRAHAVGGRLLRELVEREKYDIVHLHTPIPAFAGRVALRANRSRPVRIYSAHGFHFHAEGRRLANSLYLALEKLAGRWTDELVVMNSEDRRAALRHHLVPSERVWFMPGIGLDLDYWKRDAVSPDEVDSVRTEMGLSGDDKLILVVGALNPDKRPADALHALASLSRTDIHLGFVGSGPLLHTLNEEAERLGVASQTHFLGYRDDVRALIRASTSTLYPSIREGLPRAIMESMALGVPSIAADVRGNRDLLGGGAGLLVAPYDSQAMAQSISSLVDDGSLGGLLASRAGERIEQYDLAAILGQHEDLYSQALRR